MDLVGWYGTLFPTDEAIVSFYRKRVNYFFLFVFAFSFSVSTWPLSAITLWPSTNFFQPTKQKVENSFFAWIGAVYHLPQPCQLFIIRASYRPRK